MSADVWYEAPACQACGGAGGSGGDFNLTYNLSPMLWGAGMPAWSDMIGLPAHEAAAIWEAVVDELKRDPDLYRTLNPPNGWGTYEQAVDTLSQAAEDFLRAPKGSVVGGWL